MMSRGLARLLHRTVVALKNHHSLVETDIEHQFAPLASHHVADRLRRHAMRIQKIRNGLHARRNFAWQFFAQHNHARMRISQRIAHLHRVHALSRAIQNVGLAKAFRENLFAAYAVEHRQNQRIFANKARGGFHRAAQAALFGRKDHQIDGFRFFGRHVSKRHGAPLQVTPCF